MAEPSPSWKNPANAYRFTGVVFLVAAVIFVFTGNSAMWISMFTLGIVFLTLSMTVGREAAKQDPDADAEPPAS